MFCIDIDISGRKAAEEEARYLAFYDALTRLPNRRLLVDRLQQVMASSAARAQRRRAVCGPGQLQDPERQPGP
jgi:GGDEF domain-containing protein